MIQIICLSVYSKTAVSSLKAVTTAILFTEVASDFGTVAGTQLGLSEHVLTSWTLNTYYVQCPVYMNLKNLKKVQEFGGLGGG